MYATFLITVLAESEYSLAVKFDLELVKRVLVETDLNSGILFISRLPNLIASLLSGPSWNWCWLSLSPNYAIEAITLQIYLLVTYIPLLFLTKVCVVTCSLVFLCS
jgi:hypothetical protein